jgi:hypothetical protein
VLPDKKADQSKYLRVSGEDYLYSAINFFVVELPQHVERSLQRLAPATVS